MEKGFVICTERSQSFLIRHVVIRLVLLMAWCAPDVACAADKQEATTSRAARREAVRAIPYYDMTTAMQRRIHGIVNKPTVFRRLPTNTIDCDPDLYVFLLRNPHVVVDIWKLMGVTQIDLKQTGEYSFQARDGAGTSSQVELVYGTGDLHVYYGEGVYDGPLMRRPVRGRCVVLVRSAYRRDAAGRTQITSVLDMFLQIDNLAVDALAKTFQPFFGKYADYNFAETARFLGRLSRTAEEKPDGVQQLSQRLTVAPDTRNQFSAITANVALRAHVASSPSPIRRSSLEQEAISRLPVDYPRWR